MPRPVRRRRRNDGGAEPRSASESQDSEPPTARADAAAGMRAGGGRRACSSAIPAGSSGCFSSPGWRGEVGGFCAALARARKPYREVDAAELARVAGTLLHGGVAAIARPQPLAAFDPAAWPDWARDGKPLLVLDGIGNPHNLGAIARTAAFFGIERDRARRPAGTGAALGCKLPRRRRRARARDAHQASLPAAAGRAAAKLPDRRRGASAAATPWARVSGEQAAGADPRQRGEGSRPRHSRRLRRDRDDPRQRPGAIAQRRRGGGDPDLRA